MLFGSRERLAEEVSELKRWREEGDKQVADLETRILPSKLSEKEHWISGNFLEDSMSNPVYIGDPTDTDCRLNWLLIHQEMS